MVEVDCALGWTRQTTYWALLGRKATLVSEMLGVCVGKFFKCCCLSSLDNDQLDYHTLYGRWCYFYHYNYINKRIFNFALTYSLLKVQISQLYAVAARGFFSRQAAITSSLITTIIFN